MLCTLWNFHFSIKLRLRKGMVSYWISIFILLKATFSLLFIYVTHVLCHTTSAIVMTKQQHQPKFTLERVKTRYLFIFRLNPSCFTLQMKAKLFLQCKLDWFRLNTRQLNSLMKLTEVLLDCYQWLVDLITYSSCKLFLKATMFRSPMLFCLQIRLYL